MLPARRAADGHRLQRQCWGRFSPIIFPKCSERRGSIYRCRNSSENFAALAAEIEAATGKKQTPEEVAEGFIRVAVANMANAIKRVSVQRGHDVTQYTLACFGGAGGQHACLVADELGMTSVYIHPFAGVLSAYGMGLADVTAMREKATETRVEESALHRIRADMDALTQSATGEVLSQGAPPSASNYASAPICATKERIRRSSRRSARSPTCGGLRDGIQAALQLPDAGSGDHHRSDLRRSHC